MNRLLNVEELAQYLNLQKQTIYNWLSQRKISGIKIGGVWRFNKREIDKWLRAQARKTIPEQLKPAGHRHWRDPAKSGDRQAGSTING